MTQPSTFDLNAHISDDLTERDSWLLWRYQGMKGTKVPFTTAGKSASSTDPKTWTTFADVVATYSKYPGAFAGIGYVFTSDDPFTGVDLDSCLADGNPKPWVQPVIERFSDTYAEISPSGFGIKVFCKAKLPGKGVGKTPVLGKDNPDSVEIYDTGRFFTVTGRRFRGAPDEIEDHQHDVEVIIERLAAGKQQKGSNTLPVTEKVPVGQRHKKMLSLVGAMRRWHVCESGILACLLEVNQCQFEEPKEVAQIVKLIESSRTWRQS
jgi:primase-polymerase (primpol)-like protein